MASEILAKVMFLEKFIGDKLAEMKVKLERHEQNDPILIRSHYDIYWNEVDVVETNYKKQKDQLIDIIPHINNCIDEIDDILKVTEQIKININKKQVGTLQGKSRQSIYRNYLRAENELQGEVLEQKYNEMEHIGGGFRKKTKGKKSKKRCKPLKI